MLPPSLLFPSHWQLWPYSSADNFWVWENPTNDNIARPWSSSKFKSSAGRLNKLKTNPRTKAAPAEGKPSWAWGGWRCGGSLVRPAAWKGKTIWAARSGGSVRTAPLHQGEEERKDVLVERRAGTEHGARRKLNQINSKQAG